MTGHKRPRHVSILLLLFISASALHLCLCSAPGEEVIGEEAARELQRVKRREERSPPETPEEEEEEEEELFKDVDPRKLAAVLLEALNHSQVRKEEEDVPAERRAMEKPERVEGEEGADRHREGREELERLIASHAKEREAEEEEERKRAKEQEEKMTEKVTSRTTSQDVQVRKEEQQRGSDGGRGGNEDEQDEDEEQLNPEELRSLETMMKEFPRLDVEGDLERRQTRAYSSYNDVIPKYKSGDPALTNKKLKWQEETQKALYFPKFDEDNFIKEPKQKSYNLKSGQALPQLPPPPEEEEQQEDEESPEEEEARAKVEQQEVLRQVAEARKAKMEEEKLADIASDMLLRYMGKEKSGRRRRPSATFFNAAEDKRSDEEQDGPVEENDIDPQTIDKLIEISSKLHLPADDVVDIITDAEKKKKDAVAQVGSSWQRPQSSSLAQRPPSNEWQIPMGLKVRPVAKQPPPPANLLKTWFEEKSKLRPAALQNKPANILLSTPGLWSKAARLQSVQPDRLPPPTKPLWSSYASHPYAYTSYYQRNPFLTYYPVYLPTAPRPKPRYYASNPALALNSLRVSSLDNANPYPPRRRYDGWVRPQLGKPPLRLLHNTYFPGYPPQRSTPEQRGAPPLQYTSDRGASTTKGQAGVSGLGDLEAYIQRILMERSQKMD